MYSLRSYINEGYVSSPDDVRVTIDGVFYKLDAYQPNAFPFAWGINEDDTLLTCAKNAPDWKRIHAIMYMDKYGDVLPERANIKHQGRLWMPVGNRQYVVAVFWEEMSAVEAVEAARELIDKWNAKHARKGKLDPEKTMVIVGDTAINVAAGPEGKQKSIKDTDKSEAYAVHLASAEEKLKKMGGYLKNRRENMTKKLGDMSPAEYHFRKYQESMKSLKQFILQS